MDDGLNELRMLQRFSGHPNIVELVDHGSGPLPVPPGAKQKTPPPGRPVRVNQL